MAEMNVSAVKVIKKKVCQERRELRRAGKPYTTSSGKNREGKQLPPADITCKCSNACKTLTKEYRESLFNSFYALTEKDQGTYILNRLELGPVQRRRNGKYEEPEESRRQSTFFYVVPNGSGEHVRVCCKTFSSIFALSARRLQTVQKQKKEGNLVFEDKRGKTAGSNAHKKKFCGNDVEMIAAHIKSFPREVSHYSRKKSKKEYLSPDLNYSRLYSAFKKEHPDSLVTYNYYKFIFKRDFKNLKFARPRSDTCNTCDKLEAKIVANTSSSEKDDATLHLNLHVRRSEKAQDEMRCDTISSQMPGSGLTVFCMDLQQVLFVPTLTHSRMFYSRQLSCYNLCIHDTTNNESYMNVWNESIAGRGGNEIASCLFNILTTKALGTRRVVIWADNCAGQNKNRMVVFVILYLVAKQYFDEVTLKFFVTGHSFMPCDRDFGLIEKRKQIMKAMTPSDLDAVILSSRPSKPFHIVHMDIEHFFDFAALADTFLNTSKLSISKASQVKVTKDDLSSVEIKVSFSDLLPWKKHPIFKKRQIPSHLPSGLLFPRLTFVKGISEEKKKDLLAMCDFLKKQEHKDFYRNLCGLNVQ